MGICKRNMMHLAGAVCIVVASCLSTAVLNAGRYVRLVKVRNSTGTVKTWHAKSKTWTATQPGDFFYPRDQIMTGRGGAVSLFFQDGSEIHIGGDSLVHVDELLVEKDEQNITVKKDTVFTVWLGMVRGIIRPLKDHDRFEINMPTAVCAIRGTDLGITVGADEISVVRVYDGTVGVKDRAGAGMEKIVSKGQQVTVTPGMPVPDPEPLGEADEIPSEESLPAPAERPSSPGMPAAGAEPAPVPGEEPAEEQAPAVSGGAGEYAIGKWITVTMNGALGAAVLNDPLTGQNKIYYKFALMPELAIWKFGLGFDLYFYFDEENRLRDKDWDDAGDIIEKIWYVRFGRKGEPVYAYLGGLKKTTIGHGLIMNNYTNMLRYPDERKTGALLDLDLGDMGMEAMVADIDQAEVFGGRFFVRPLKRLGIPLISRLAVGIGGAVDRDPDSDDSTKDDEVILYGIDAELPILSMRYVSAAVYGDVARMKLGDRYILGGSKDKGTGYSAGLMGKMLFASYRAEYRTFENNFVPSYFDTFYDRDRFDTVLGTGKADTVPGTSEPKRTGPYVELGFGLLSLIDFTASYENYNQDMNSRYPLVHGELTVDPRLLLNKFTFSAVYDRRNTHTFNDLKELAGAVVTVELGYRVAPNIVMVMVQRQTFDAQGRADKTVEVEARIQF